MNHQKRSMLSAYEVGRVCSFLFLGAMIYIIYGFAYWFTTGSFYFGPWEWGLALITSILTTLYWNSDQQSKVEKAKDRLSKQA